MENSFVFYVFKQQMPSSNRRNTLQDNATSRTSYHNNSSQQYRESETGISVDRQYDTDYNAIREGDYNTLNK